MNSHARLTTWRQKEDLLELRSLFFPANSPPDSIHMSREHRESILKAMAQVHLYSSRGRLPHTLQSTAHLYSVLISFSDGSLAGDEDAVRLAASMALIRFVNGLLDPGQQSLYAIPLQVLAKKIGLPTVFVEFRHAATHEGMPSQEMCVRCVLGAVEWLFSNYWKDIEMKVDLADVEEEKERLKEEEQKERSAVLDLWKQYRRVRRRDINKVIKPGDTTEIGTEYWTCVHGLQAKLSNENEWWKLGYQVMVGRITSSKLSFEQLKKLYEPILNYMIRHLEEDFVVSLIDLLLNMCYEYSRFKGLGDSKVFASDSEWKHAKRWSEWLVLDKVELYDDCAIDKIVEALGKKPDQFHVDVLKRLKTKAINSQHGVKVDSKINLLQNILTESQAKRFNDTDDILGDLEKLKKRKLERAKPTEALHKNFERHTNWDPKPFGIL